MNAEPHRDPTGLPEREAEMALRWTAAGMLEAAKGFLRLRAHKQLPVLKEALLKHREPGTTGVDQTADAA